MLAEKIFAECQGQGADDLVIHPDQGCGAVEIVVHFQEMLGADGLKVLLVPQG